MSTLIPIKKLLIYSSLQSRHPKQNQEQIMHEINKLRMLHKLEQKATRSVKKE